MSKIRRKDKDYFKHNKMKPYVEEHKMGNGKFEVELGLGLGISKLGKLITKNANRSLKKSARREGKLNINKIKKLKF